MRIFPALMGLAVPLCLLCSCGSKGAVSLTVFSSNESLIVRSSPFGGSAQVDGAFQLELVVGGEASGGSDVNLGNFSLQTEAGAALVDVLEVESSTVFPVHVDKGSSERASLTFKADVADAAAVCEGSVLIVGSVEDSLSGNSQPVRSALITPSCP